MELIIRDGKTTVTVAATELVNNPWGIPTDPEKLLRFARIFAGVRDGDRAALAEPLRSGPRPRLRIR